MWKSLIKEELILNHHYWNLYIKLIEIIPDREKTSGMELHHIWPKSLGRNDEPYNLKVLTRREHYLAHWILSRAIRGKMSKAFWMMTIFERKSGRLYEEAIKNFVPHKH